MAQPPEPHQTVIATTPLEIGGEQSVSVLPDGYEGLCQIEGDDRILAVVPDTTQGFRIARYAITPDGGYTDVRVAPSDRAPTHWTLEHWLSDREPVIG